MIRFENKYVIGLLNLLSNTHNTERKIVWAEFGKKIEFGISKPLPFGCGSGMGLRFYAEFGYFEYFKKIILLWMSVIKEKKIEKK